MDPIKAVADAVMRGVVRSGVLDGATDEKITAAVAIMREELKALVVADADPEGKYTASRECVRTGSLHNGYVLALVVANSVERILAC